MHPAPGPGHARSGTVLSCQSSAPTTIIFLIFQRQFVAALANTGIK